MIIHKTLLILKKTNLVYNIVIPYTNHTILLQLLYPIDNSKLKHKNSLPKFAFFLFFVYNNNILYYIQKIWKAKEQLENI